MYGLLMTTTMVPAAPRTVGTHFLGGEIPADHECKAACYRVSKHRGREYISTLCHYGHAVSMRETGARTSFAGSAFAASLNDLPAHAPFVLAAQEG
jgi:hypothetical protein